MSAITRSIQAMDLLARKGPLGVRAVAQQLSLPLGSVHRLLLDLSEEGIVDRTPAGEWELSYRLLEITGLQLDRIELPRLCRPFAEAIAAATGETVNLNILHGRDGVCVDKVRGNEGMQLDFRIGSRAPLTTGGGGKAMLAFIAAEARADILAGPLPSYTPATITDPAALAAELARIARRGYAIDDQEVVTGIFCVGVPILDRHGHAVAALSVTGPSPKAAGPAIAPIVAMLRDACRHVSHRLGHTGPWPGPSPEENTL